MTTEVSNALNSLAQIDSSSPQEVGWQVPMDSQYNPGNNRIRDFYHIRNNSTMEQIYKVWEKLIYLHTNYSEADLIPVKIDKIKILSEHWKGKETIKDIEYHIGKKYWRVNQNKLYLNALDFIEKTSLQEKLYWFDPTV